MCRALAAEREREKAEREKKKRGASVFDGARNAHKKKKSMPSLLALAAAARRGRRPAAAWTRPGVLAGLRCAARPGVVGLRALASSSSAKPPTKARADDADASPRPRPAIDRLLIANRGEIACRIIATAKRLGEYRRVLGNRVPLVSRGRLCKNARAPGGPARPLATPPNHSHTFTPPSFPPQASPPSPSTRTRTRPRPTSAWPTRRGG
jgi:hypothetical protein